MASAVQPAVAHRFWGMFLTAGLGIVIAAGQAPVSLPWLALAGWMLALVRISRTPDWRLAGWLGWALGLGHFAAALHWIVEPFLVDIARYGWMAPFALVLMAGGLALFWGGAFALAARLSGGSRRRGVVLAVILLTGAEMLRGILFTGFPWATIGHVWIGWPHMQLAALAGAPGLTLLTLTAAALPALCGARRAAVGLIAGAALTGLAGAWGQWRVPDGSAPVTGLTVRLVQPNAAQHLKWLPENVMMFFERQLEMTAAEPAPGRARPEVVIWPETSVPYLLDSADQALNWIAGAASGAQVALGMQRRDTTGRWFNVLARLDETGRLAGTYDKHHLVPFGEYMPLAAMFARMGVFGLAANETGGFSAGPGPQTMRFGAAGEVVPLICYEAIFPRDLARAPARADWLMQITNDAWFGQLSGPYQHLAQARLRAVEQGLPLFRAANTGVSAGFDPYGAELGRIALNTAGFLDLDLPEPLPPTPYVGYGDLPLTALLACVFAICLAGSRVRKLDDVGPTD